MNTTYTIDATGKKLGRVASEAAYVLLGKSGPDFRRNVASDTIVEIINVSKLALSETKQEKKIYTHYTGYPSGLRTKTMGKVISEKGYTEIVRRAVQGMLPRNKLRARRIKNLVVKD